MVPNDLCLPATAHNCFWGHLDPAVPPVLAVEPGATVLIEAVTHHSGDAPDLLMDDGIRALWAGIPPDERGPGVHIMTGPVQVAGAEPGDRLVVEILSTIPRLRYGSNCAAHWGLLHDTFGKERITIYELEDAADDQCGSTVRPCFGFDFTARPLYDRPGVISEPDPAHRQAFGRQVSIPVRPHLGVMGVAPPDERRSSIPPGVWGGNVDNWRFGPGATVSYPVFTEGAGFYVGDPHFAQGDGEICGTAIEASLDVTVRLSLEKAHPLGAPLLETETHRFTHGFGDDLHGAMRMAAEQMLQLLGDQYGLSRDEAYSVASAGVDLGIIQVVDGTLGCHAALAKSIFI